MSTVLYRAMDRSGGAVAGTLEADDHAGAATQLRAQGLFVVHLSSAPAPASNGRPHPWLTIPVRGRHVEDTLRRLSLMIRSGLTALQALEVAASQTRSRALRRSLERIAASVRTGSSLSAAFEREQGIVPPLVAQMVAAAEASGELDVVLERVATTLERAREVRSGLLTSLFYPGIVVVMSVGVGAYLTLVVVPKFSRFLEARNAPLPESTRLLMAMPEIVETWGPLVAAVAMAAIVAVVLARRTPRGGRAVDASVLRVPVLGGLFAAAVLSQACRTLSLLLRSGVTLLDALRIVGAAAGNRAIAHSFATAASDVLRGRTLSESLRGRPLPDLVAQVVHVGERTGEMDKVLEELGTFYERELAIGAKRAATLFEPMVVVAIGAVVGFVYYAFFQVAFSVAR